jgi:hypothetical protein
MPPPRDEGGVITFVKYDRGPIGISIGPGGVILGIHQNKQFMFENSYCVTRTIDSPLS